MKVFTNSLRSRFEQALRQVSVSNSNPVERVLFSLKQMENALWEMKEFAIGYLNLTQMTDKFGRRLGYEPRNIHQLVKNIRGRKKDRTVFLQQLI